MCLARNRSIRVLAAAWWPADRAVSIWTVEGRRIIPFVGGEHQYALLATRKGESDLTYQGSKFYLAATCDVQEAPLLDAPEFLGVDLGVRNIASDSDGKRHSGSEVNSVRYRHRRLRCNLQKKQTRAAKRRLKKLSGKEARFARHTNHVISKEIVACAKGTNRGIKLEDLSGIRDRVDTFGRRQRVSSQQLGVPPVGAVRGLQGAARWCPGDLCQPQEHQPRVLPVRPHRQGEPSQPIDIPLSGVCARRQRRHQRCQGDFW